jgi:hypothetical protein
MEKEVIQMKRILLAALLLAGIGGVAWGISTATSSNGCPLEGTPECPLIPSCCK